MYNRVKEEVTRRMKIITKTELKNKNFTKAINTKVMPVPVAAYPINVCKFNQWKLVDLDQFIK